MNSYIYYKPSKTGMLLLRPIILAFGRPTDKLTKFLVSIYSDVTINSYIKYSYLVDETLQHCCNPNETKNSTKYSSFVFPDHII